MTTDLRKIKRDRFGYLQSGSDWNPAVAQALAAEEGIFLNEDHWQVLNILRRFHASHDLVPNNRVLVKLVREHLGADKGNSAWLMGLFPGGALKQGCKLAGLPRPEQCF